MKAFNNKLLCRHIFNLEDINTAWKVPKYGAISGPYFPVFGVNTGKYRPKITPYFHSVNDLVSIFISNSEHIFSIK